MCREAIKKFSGCKATLRELFICVNFINFTFENPEALAIDCPHYQCYNIQLPGGRCDCMTGFMCSFKSRDGERIVTFEEIENDDTEEGRGYYELRNAMGNGMLWEMEVESRKSQTVQPDSDQLAYRRRIGAILEQEAIECQAQLQAQQVTVRSEGSMQCDAKEEHIYPDETEEDPDMAEDPTEPRPKRRKTTQPAAVKDTRNETFGFNAVNSITLSVQDSPTSLSQLLSDIKIKFLGPHLEDSIRYKYLGERRTPEEWKFEADKEKGRIMTHLQGLLAKAKPGTNGYTKLERKLQVEQTRWDDMLKEVKVLESLGDARGSHELLLYVNENEIQKQKRTSEWDMVISRLNQLNLKRLPLPDVITECKNMAAYNYIPGQTKTRHEWLKIVEKEKKRCVRELVTRNRKGRPIVPTDLSKGELRRWDNMYREAAELREGGSDARNLHEIVLALHCSIPRTPEIMEVIKKE